MIFRSTKWPFFVFCFLKRTLQFQEINFQRKPMSVLHICSWPLSARNQDTTDIALLSLNYTAGSICKCRVNLQRSVIKSEKEGGKKRVQLRKEVRSCSCSFQLVLTWRGVIWTEERQNILAKEAWATSLESLERIMCLGGGYFSVPRGRAGAMGETCQSGVLGQVGRSS